MTHDEQNNSSDTGTKVLMTHDELLDTIGHWNWVEPEPLLKALRAVVEYLKKMYDWEETWKGDMPMTMEQLGRREERIRITAELKELIEKELQ